MDPLSWLSYDFLKDLYKEMKEFTWNWRINRLSPILYLSLKKDFSNRAESGDERTYVFPFMKEEGNLVEPIEFRKDGFFFSGHHMISVCLRGLPVGQSPRTFSLAVKPTAFPTKAVPMFFFSYGRRDHDQAFGIYWGAPDVPELKVASDIGLRVFYYCGLKPETRKTSTTDSPVFFSPIKIGDWLHIIVSYDGQTVDVYLNDKNVLSEKVALSTGNTQYLNIGGFLHHIENGALLPKDMKYSMKGYVREFFAFDRVLSDVERKKVIAISRQRLRNAA